MSSGNPLFRGQVTEHRRLLVVEAAHKPIVNIYVLYFKPAFTFSASCEIPEPRLPWFPEFYYMRRDRRGPLRCIDQCRPTPLAYSSEDQLAPLTAASLAAGGLASDPCVQPSA